MASIKGLQLKAIKKTHGMEDEGFVANLYFNGKKVGYCADYGDGGPLSVRYDDQKVKEQIEQQVKAYYAEHHAEDPRLETLSDLIYRLHTLSSLESSFKKCVKEGWPYLVFLDIPLTYNGKFPESEAAAYKNEKVADEQKKALETEYPGCKALVFKSIADFIIL